MPDLDQVTIGSGKQFWLSVLFLDIVEFSRRPSGTFEEQKSVLATLNIFMAEMLNIVRDFGGTFEKNTGDGLMAYFGTEGGTEDDKVASAVFASTVMHYVNDNLLTPRLISLELPAVHFRIGIDFGPVTIGRVGIRGNENAFVAIGATANIAHKIMRLIPEGGICVGNDVYLHLPSGWNTACQVISQPTGFVYVKTQEPYKAHLLTHRLMTPGYALLASLLGGYR